MAPGATADGPAPPDAVTVVLTVHNVEMMRQGLLEALVAVELDLSGILIELQVMVLAPREGGLCCLVPSFTRPDKSRVPAVKLPSDLWQAVSDEVLAAVAQAS